MRPGCLMRLGSQMSFGGLLEDLGLQDQGHRAELLQHGDDDADDESGNERRKYDRAEGAHLTASVAGEGVRMAHIVRGVVDDVDMREADDPDDEKAKHHRHQRLRQPSDLTRDLAGRGCSRQLRDLRLSHYCSPDCSPSPICFDSSNFRAMSRLVKCRFVPVGMPLRAILRRAAARNASSNFAKYAKKASCVGSAPSSVRNAPR